MGAARKAAAVSGLGVDLVEVSRIKRLGASRRFLERVFTPAELEYSLKSANRYERLAARFAAKEAVIKALGDTSLPLNSIEVESTGNGSPRVSVKGRRGLTLMISITHTAKYACAAVIAFR